jgi:hypothetical protein
MARQQQARAKMLDEDLQLLREEFAIIEPKAVRVEIHSYVDQSDQGIVVEGINVYDELGHLIPYQGQDGDNWIEALSAEYLGYILHCLYDPEAAGDHTFTLKETDLA